MPGAVMTQRRPTVSTAETVTSYMVLTSCLASKFGCSLGSPAITVVTPPPLPRHSSFNPSFMSASLSHSDLSHCPAGHCTRLSSVQAYMHLQPTQLLTALFRRHVVYSFCQSQVKIFFSIKKMTYLILTLFLCPHALKLCFADIK